MTDPKTRALELALWPLTLAIELVGLFRGWLWDREQSHIRRALEELDP